MKTNHMPITGGFSFFLKTSKCTVRKKLACETKPPAQKWREEIAQFKSRKIASEPLWLKHFQTTLNSHDVVQIGTPGCQDLTVEGLKKHL